jgi:DNA-binding transcriptional ArsR family regulator
MSRRASQATALRDRAPVFAALGDDTRLGIVTRLCRSGPASIADLTEGSGVTRQAVAKHLRILEGAGLVRATRTGRESSWQLLPGGLDEARAGLDLISRQWDAALERLRAFVEERPKR